MKLAQFSTPRYAYHTQELVSIKTSPSALEKYSPFAVVAASFCVSKAGRSCCETAHTRPGLQQLQHLRSSLYSPTGSDSSAKDQLNSLIPLTWFTPGLL